MMIGVEAETQRYSFIFIFLLLSLCGDITREVCTFVSFFLFSFCCVTVELCVCVWVQLCAFVCTAFTRPVISMKRGMLRLKLSHPET